jgi:golgi apparatus protein 1
VCREDLESDRLAECKSAEPINGHLVSCLLDHRENATSDTCKSFLTNIAALIFSDYRLIYNFHNDCEQDIQTFKCGRIERDDNENNNKGAASQQPVANSQNLGSNTQQGGTLECLANSFQSLQLKCRKQIVRITELQSDDFHLDRPLYFACREDRERFCERIASGDGRVYKCLLKQKFNPEMSKPCRQQLERRQKIMVQNVQADRGFLRACKKDILKHECRKELRIGDDQTMQLNNLILCLEKAIRDGDEIDPACKVELIEHRKMIMSDYQLNPNIVNYCEQEIKTYCDRGQDRGGKTLHCLLKYAKKYLTKKDSKIIFSDRCVAEVRKAF